MEREISNLKVNNESDINLSDAIRLFNLDITGSLLANEILYLISKIKEVSWDPINGGDYLILSLIAKSANKCDLDIEKIRFSKPDIVSCESTRFNYNIIINSNKSTIERFKNNLRNYFNFE